MTTSENIPSQQELALSRIQEASNASQEAKLQASLATEQLKAVIREGRDDGVLWADIGKIVGMSPQRAFDMVNREAPAATAVPRQVGLDVETFAERTGRSVEEVESGIGRGEYRLMLGSDKWVRILSNPRNFTVDNS